LTTVYDVTIAGPLTRDLVCTGTANSLVSRGLPQAVRAVLEQGLSCHAYARLAQRDFHHLQELEQAGAAVSPVESFETTGCSIGGTDSHNDELKVLGSCGALLPEDLGEFPGTRLFLAAPFLRGEIPLETLRHISAIAPLAVDLDGYIWRRQHSHAAPAPYEGLREALSLCRCVGAGALEAMVATGAADPPEAARRLAALGPAHVLLLDRNQLLVHSRSNLRRDPVRQRPPGPRASTATALARYAGEWLDTESQPNPFT
jgi:hypothetical protein